MKKAIGGLLLSAITLATSFAGTRREPIALYYDFQHEPSPTVRNAMREELVAIMTPLGMTFRWFPLRGQQEYPAVTEMVVATFLGHCDLTSPTSFDAKGRVALGWTHVSNGEILPFTNIDCNSIRAFLERDLMESPGREEAYGRAVARVLAHEVYHIVADTARHGVCGIGKESYTVQDLLSGAFFFEGREFKALKGKDSKTNPIVGYNRQ